MDGRDARRGIQKSWTRTIREVSARLKTADHLELLVRVLEVHKVLLLRQINRKRLAAQAGRS